MDAGEDASPGGARGPRVHALRLEDVRHSYRQAGHDVEVLAGVDLAVGHGETVAVVGRSGSGKSTLLHIAAGLVEPSAGRVLVDGRTMDQRGAQARALLRRRHIGFVFQFFHLLGHLRVVDNVALPLILDGRSRPSARRRARELLADLGLSAQADGWPAELSGGEMQRVAIARALVNQPELVLADEPTGNLDAATARAVLEVLFSRARAHRAAMVVATHDQTVAAGADRIVHLVDGQVVPAASAGNS